MGLEYMEKIKKNGEKLTIVLASKEIFVVVSVPRENLNEISYERGDLTFKHDTVPKNDVLLVHVSVVMLGNHFVINKTYYPITLEL